MDIQGEAKVAVAGLEGPFERDELIEQLAQVGEATGCTLQAFDPDAVYGPEHLEAAARKALRAHREGRALARDLAAEIACYAAGTHQIKEALATTGLPQQGDALAVVA
ncbi:MAG: KEOPS complex subunit Cgi121, partial [Candidatus Thermoplasmatota archaeon]|nr:KEOPS complex subunit Cgi121 [Candidatus Thermoplasmatota archaeon]